MTRRTSTGDWMTIHGGSERDRETITRGFRCELFDDPSDSVQRMAERVQAHVTVAFTDAVHLRASEIATAVSEPDTYLIVLVDRLEPAAFREALVAGAAGVAHMDNSIEHLCDVTKAALRHDLLLPRQVVRSIAAASSPVEEQLTALSISILRCIDEGMGTKQIAANLHLSERTARRRVHNLCIALGVATPAQAVQAARQRNLA